MMPTSPEDPVGPPRSESLALDFDLPHAPERVWRALTDPLLLSEWLLPAIGFKLEQGASFRFQTEAKPGWDGTVNCVVLEVETHKRISWRWVVGDIDTVVAFTITPLAAGTHLSIVHSGFKPDQKQALGGANYGWKMMSGRLAELLLRSPE